MASTRPAKPVNPRKNLQGPGAKAQIQRFGGYLAGMIMPNIGAFIAWGLLTALFIPTGWWPQADLAEDVVGPMIKYLLPILIGYTGGRLVHGQRGAVVGAVATFGVVAGADTPMFIGAMIIGPLAAFIIKQFDRLVADRVPSGFEMLIDNFSAGILGAIIAYIGYEVVGPVVQTLTNALGDGVDFLVTNNLLPVASVLVEPAKILFLNNAINQGVFTPLGASDVQETGQSVLFMIESNPGPGLGMLIAFFLFGPRTLRPTAPGAMIIHFLGGIHEIYFPYVLAKPKLVLAMIVGGASGVLTAVITGAGLVASPSPGSIFAYLIVTPQGGHLSVLTSIAVPIVVTFLMASLLLGFGRGEKDEELTTPEAALDESAPSSTEAGNTVTTTRTSEV